MNYLKALVIAAIAGVIIGIFSGLTKTTITGPHWVPEVLLVGLYMMFGYLAYKNLEDKKEK